MGMLEVTMIYSLQLYADAGRREAECLNKDDLASAHFHNQWAKFAMQCEHEPDRIFAEHEYKKAYRRAREPHLQTIRMKAQQPVRRRA